MYRLPNKASLLRKLLLHEISVSQLLVYSIGIFLGISIIGVGFQLNRDIRFAGDNEKRGENGNTFLVISHRIDGIVLKSKEKNQNIDIIKSLSAIPNVVDVANFQTADFNVVASVDFMGRGMSTALFLESVPENFLDVKPGNWSFNPDDEDAYVPIIIPKDYLALYNFGFAASRGLPKIGEDMMYALPLKISLSGNGRQKWLNARIVAFSNRINSILVPPSLISWGNNVFSDKDVANSGRYIVEFSGSLRHSDFEKILENYNLEINGPEGMIGEMSRVAETIVTVVMIIGLVIACLSIVLLFVSILLLIHKTRNVIRKLLLLGYYPFRICIEYVAIYGIINVLMFGLSVGALEITQHYLSGLMISSGINIDIATLETILVMFAITFFISVMCWLIFQKTISKIR